MWLPSSLQCHGDPPHSQRFAAYPYIWPDHWYAENRTRKKHSHSKRVQKRVTENPPPAFSRFFWLWSYSVLPLLRLRWKSTQAPSLHPTWLSARLRWSLWGQSTVTWSAALRWLTACRTQSTTSTNMAVPTLMSLSQRMKRQLNSSCSKWTVLVYSGTAALALLMATASV